MLGIRLVTATVLTGVLAAAACGGDDDDDSPSAQAGEYVEALAQTPGGQLFGPSEDRQSDNECFARAFVDVVGVDALAAVVTPDELRQNPDTPVVELGIEISEDDGNALYDELSGCADVTRLIAELTTSGQGLAPETEACIEREFNEDLVRRIFVTTITQNADSTVRAGLEDEMAAAMAPCLEPGTLSGD